MRIPNWYRVESNGIRFYQAWNLHAAELVRHGFSARPGGVSGEPYDTLNLGLHTQDDPENVIRNRRAFAEALGDDATSIVVPAQAHSSNVVRVGAQEVGSGALGHATAIPDTDALITNARGVTLALHFADCVPVFLVDPVNKAVGLVHAGWKGTAAGIAREAIGAMRRDFGTNPRELHAAVGPAICRHCYDVGEDVAGELFAAFPHDERVVRQSGSSKWRADLKTANLILLVNAGLDAGNIAVSDKCTSCSRDEFFSYRRDGETGRMGAWMRLI